MKKNKRILNQNKIRLFANKKSGVTLVETIVAMALVVIISAMAFSICSLSLNSSNKTKLKNFFTVQTQNYVQAYFLGGDHYKNSMELLTGTQYEYGDNKTIYYSKDLEVSTESEYGYYVNLNFDNSFLVECYTSNDSLIYSYEV